MIRSPDKRQDGGRWSLPWDELLRALVLIRMGQELGTDSATARAVAGAIDLWVEIAKKCLP